MASPPMSPTASNRPAEVTGPLSSADRKEILRLVEGYGRWWDHIRFRKGWATPYFEKDATIEAFLKRAAEYVVRIRRWVDGKESGMSMRLLEGLSHEFFWSVEDWQPATDQRRFIRELVHATLKDGRGYLDGLTEEDVDAKMKAIETYWAGLPPHHPQRPTHETQNVTPEEVRKRLRENLLHVGAAAEQVTLESLSSQSNRSRVQSVCTLLSRAEALLKSLTDATEDERHEEFAESSFPVPQSETEAQMTFSLSGVETVASPTTPTPPPTIPIPTTSAAPSPEPPKEDQSPTKTGVAAFSASPTVEHVATPQESEEEGSEGEGEDSVGRITEGGNADATQQHQTPPQVEEIEDEDDDEEDEGSESDVGGVKVSQPAMSPTSHRSVTVSSVGDDDEHGQGHHESNEATATDNEQQSQEPPIEIPTGGEEGNLKRDDSVKLKINKVQEEVLTKEKEVQHLLQDCDQIDMHEILQNATQGEKVIEGLQKRALWTSEVLMKDLLTLDQLTCATPESRQQRKEQVRQIQEIMDIVDDLSQKLRDLHSSVHARRKVEEEERKKREDEERKRLEAEAARALHAKRQKLHEFIDQVLPEAMQDVEQWQDLKIEPRFQTTENRDQYVIAARVPGMNKRDVDISLTNDSTHLIVSGLRLPTHVEAQDVLYRAHQLADDGKYDDIDDRSVDAAHILLPAAGGKFGHFRQNYKLPSDAIPQDIEGSYDSGLLQVVIPRHRRPAVHGPPRSRSPYGDPFSSLLGGSRNEFLDMFAPQPHQHPNYGRRSGGGGGPDPYARSRTGFW